MVYPKHLAFRMKADIRLSVIHLGFKDVAQSRLKAERQTRKLGLKVDI